MVTRMDPEKEDSMPRRDILGVGDRWGGQDTYLKKPERLGSGKVSDYFQI